MRQIVNGCVGGKARSESSMPLQVFRHILSEDAQWHVRKAYSPPTNVATASQLTSLNSALRLHNSNTPYANYASTAKVEMARLSIRRTRSGGGAVSAAACFDPVAAAGDSTMSLLLH